MENFNIEKIDNTIWIFKNAIKNHKEIINYFEHNMEWEDWYTFGKVTLTTGPTYSFNSFPSKDEWSKNIKNNLNPSVDFKYTTIKEQIDNLFYDITSVYLEQNKLSLNNWIFENWNLAKYNAVEDILYKNNKDSYIMHHHTDFQREIEYSPGNKFGVTVVFYLNDNYEGGEVEYRIIKDKDLSSVAEDYTYKPSAGDIAVFFSGHPHYHGVKKITRGNKYIIRAYWKYQQDAHPKWIELKTKYGDAWEQMEKDRHAYDRRHSGMVNNIPVVMNFETYYQKLENNDLLS